MKWEQTREFSDQPSSYEDILLREVERYPVAQNIIVCPERDEPFETTPRELRRMHDRGVLQEYYHLTFVSDNATVFWNELENRKKRIRERAFKQVEGLPDTQEIWYEETNYKGTFDSTTVGEWKDWYNHLTYARLEDESDIGGRRVVSNNPYFNPEVRYQEREMESEGLPVHTSPELLARARALQQRIEETLEAIQSRADFLKIRDMLVLTFPGEPARRMEYEDIVAELTFMTVGDLLQRGIPQIRILGLAKPLLEGVSFSTV